MPAIAPGQRYPDSNAWVDLNDLLTGTWNATASTRYFKAMGDGNTATLIGSLVIGDSPEICTLPPEFCSNATLTFPAFIRDFGTVELQMFGAGRFFVPSFAWPGPEAVAGKILIFTYSYQRKAI